MTEPDVASPAVAPAARRRFWTPLLFVIVWAQTIVPSVIDSLTSSKHQLSLTTSNGPSSGLVALLERLMVYGQMAYCILVIALFFRSARASRALPLLLTIMPWAYLVVRDAYGGDRPSVKLLAYPLLFLAIWFLRPAVRELQTVGYLVVATAAISLLMGWFAPNSGILQSAAGAGAVTEDKQILGGGVLVGPFNHGNQLGGYLVVGIVTVSMIRNRRWRRLGYLLCVYALIWSAARSSLITFAVLLLVVAVLQVSAQRFRSALGFAFLLAAGATVCLTPILATDPSAFTNRGFIWAQVLKSWSGSPVIGLGSNWFAKTAGTSELIANSAYQAHNEFLQLLTTGGIVLAAMTALLLLATAVAAALRTRLGEIYGFCFLIVVLGSGWLEASYGFVDYYQLSTVIFIPMALLVFTEVEPPDDNDSPVSVSNHPGSPVSTGVGIGA